MLQDSAGATAVPVQLSMSTANGAAVWLPVTWRSASPVLVTVTRWSGWLVVPTTTSPKSTEAGSNDTAGGSAAAVTAELPDGCRCDPAGASGCCGLGGVVVVDGGAVVAM